MAIFSLHVSLKGPRTGKASLPGNISPPCIQNELALARYARHVSEKPRKSPLEDASREYLARKGPFSPHWPLESCIPRRSCHPLPSNSGSDRKHGAALMARQNRARAASCRGGGAAEGVRGVVGCRALTEKPASAKRRLWVSDADRLAESRKPAFAGRAQGGAAARRRRSSGPAERGLLAVRAKGCFGSAQAMPPTSMTRRSRARNSQHSAR